MKRIQHKRPEVHLDISKTFKRGSKAWSYGLPLWLACSRPTASWKLDAVRRRLRWKLACGVFPIAETPPEVVASSMSRAPGVPCFFIELAGDILSMVVPYMCVFPSAYDIASRAAPPSSKHTSPWFIGGLNPTLQQLDQICLIPSVVRTSIFW